MSDNVYYDVAMKRLDEQSQRVDTLNTRAAAVYALGSSAVPIVLGFLAANRDHLTLPAQWSVGFSVLAYALVVGGCIAAYRVAKIDFRPDTPTLKGHTETYDDASLRLWVADECVRSLVANDEPLRQKAVYLGVAIVCLPFEALFLTIAALLTVW